LQPAPHRRGADRVHDPAGDGFGSQIGARPTRQGEIGLGGQLAGHGFDLGGLHVGEDLGPPGPGQITQTAQTMRSEPAAPLADRVDMDRERGRDDGVRMTVRGRPHDPGPQQVTLFGASRTDPAQQDDGSSAEFRVVSVRTYAIEEFPRAGSTPRTGGGC
jgi:hypothetical protein